MKSVGWLLILAACQRNPSKLNDELGATTNTAITETDSTPWPSSPGDTISGTVVETMGASTYTYARLDRKGEQVWVAGPETKLAVGTSLGKMAGTLMTDFRSNTLNRTIGFTVADGTNVGPFFYIPTATVSAAIPMTATVIGDNATTTAFFNFTDEFLGNVT